MALVCGIVVIGCEDSTSNSTPHSTPHSIVITGIPAEYDHDRVSIVLWDDEPGVSEDGELDAVLVAKGRGLISGDSATVELKDPNGADWDGSGRHHLQMSLDRTFHHTDGLFFVYADSKTFEELDIKESDPIEEIDAKLPTWHIDGTLSQIPFTAFDLFHELPELEEEPNYNELTGAVPAYRDWMKLLVSGGQQERGTSPVPNAKNLPNTNLANWMSRVPNSKSLKDMAIPGTHDSATFGVLRVETITGIIAEWAKCQRNESTFRRQLDDGIRAFDIRIGPDGWLTHGGIDCFVKLADTIDVFIKFLNEHPTETILACLRYENGVRSEYKKWCAPAFQGSRAGYWYLQNKIPTMREVRKRIVLINGNDDTGKPGLWLKDFEIQDDYDWGNGGQSAITRANGKADKIHEFIINTNNRKHSDSKMLFNFWNHQANAFVPIEWYANKINSLMWGWYWGNYPRGVQLMDYYWSGNVNRIIHSPVNEVDSPPWTTAAVGLKDGLIELQ
jgi:1-phosphatidylinositol phosphodiesterase